MRTRIFLSGLILLAAGMGTAGAQDATVSGRVINTPWFDAGHRLMLSGADRTYGTARSAAMSGAFTSLGADLSSMSINPAGLGMYQSSDWGITQQLSIDGMRTSAANMRPGTFDASGSRVAYGLGNVGMAFNVFNGSGTLTSFTLGFAYNRIANFNSRSRVNTVDEDSSIADFFQRQLNYMDSEGIRPGDLEASADPFGNLDIRLEEWASVMGYQLGLVGLNGEGSYGYFNGALPSDSRFSSVTRGGIHEYDLSMGANFGNFLYLGLTVGATQINYREDLVYEESYTPGGMFGDMWFDQGTRMEGSGLTAKFGAILRPAPALRIGVAFHLPTYYYLTKDYSAEMGTGGNSVGTGYPLHDDNLRFNTAPRLLAGVSGVIADRAIVALDYEVAWYNRIRMRGDRQSEVDGSLAQSRELYKPAHSLRAGLEIRPTDAIALRAGGSWTMDFMRDKNLVASNPTVRSGFGLTAGVGFTLGTNGYLDLAYIYNHSNYTNYDFYFFEQGGTIASQYDMVDGMDVPREYAQKRNHNMITLTLGSRF